jgi:hypothetical protein
MPGIPRRTLQDLKFGTGMDPSTALKTALDAGLAKDDELVGAVFARCEAGGHLLSETLVNWIIAASPSSTSVFNLMWASLRRDQWAVLKLLRGFTPARRQIEEAALEILTSVGADAGQPIRPELLRALGDVGSHRCIPWLEELRQDYEFLASRKKSMLLAAPTALTAAEEGAARESLELCVSAIASISAREALAGIAETTRGGPISRGAAMHLLEARNLAHGPMPGRSLNALRHHLEAVCDALLEHWCLTPKVKEGGYIRLADKLTALTQRVNGYDKFMFAQMCGINKLTDIGSHHSEDYFDKIAAADVKPLLEIAEGMHRRFQQI